MSEEERLLIEIEQLTDRDEDREKSKSELYERVVAQAEQGNLKPAQALKKYWKGTGNWNAKKRRKSSMKRSKPSGDCWANPDQPIDFRIAGICSFFCSNCVMRSSAAMGLFQKERDTPAPSRSNLRHFSDAICGPHLKGSQIFL